MSDHIEIQATDKEREMINEGEDDFRTNSNTNRRQPLRCKGRECVRMRRYRTATVCLVLLCVLLLTAVIVLYMKFTKETNLLESATVKPCDRLIEQNQPKWIKHKLSSYYISSEWRNWNESRQDCLQRGADLMIINDNEEQDFITQVTSGNLVWIGLSFRTEEMLWKWVDGTNITSEFWRIGEPDKSDEECVVSNYGWADYSCNLTFVWICEKRLEI
ncbi:C-type lectin domain family 4 member M [Misgurnus anguillicaudatus]|uniref:C-type lectin domain family 4 member M n=1 Tax=Misgurnus anguillicaudatus TaxID=75329 RepID=UPI003CCF2104